MIRAKGLGRGLDALLAGPDDRAAETLQNLPLEHIRAGRYQPRTRMDDASLEQLAQSIKDQGVIQPILVRPVNDGRYEIIAGERRWRAAQRAGLKEIPALVRGVADQVALAHALVENIQREDLNPLEEAQGLQRLISEFGFTHDAVAKAVGRSRSAVSNLLRLQELSKPVQAYLLSGQLDMGHARALLALSGGQQTGAAARVVAQGLSVRETERLVQQMAQPEKRKSRRSTPTGDADLARLQTELADALGAPVAIEAKRGGMGRVVIRYSTLEQLDGIIARLKR